MRALPERIRAISFDGDGTLWDFERVMRRALGFALEELRRRVDSVPVAALTVDGMVRIRTAVAQALKGRTVNLEAIRLAAFERTLESIGVRDDALARHLNDVYLAHRFEDIELYPDVLPALAGLAGRCQMGLVSNGNSYPERCGLAGRFGFTVFSQDYGYEKPDRRIFERLLAVTGCQPHEVLHVGDSLGDDVAGAQAAGIFAVWINRSRASNAAGIAPDWEIAALTELVAG